MLDDDEACSLVSADETIGPGRSRWDAQAIYYFIPRRTTRRWWWWCLLLSFLGCIESRNTLRPLFHVCQMIGIRSKLVIPAVISAQSRRCIVYYSVHSQPKILFFPFLFSVRRKHAPNLPLFWYQYFIKLRHFGPSFPLRWGRPRLLDKS